MQDHPSSAANITMLCTQRGIAAGLCTLPCEMLMSCGVHSFRNLGVRTSCAC